MMLFPAVAIGVPTLVLLVAWFAAPRSGLATQRAPREDEVPEDAWVSAPWWIL